MPDDSREMKELSSDSAVHFWNGTNQRVSYENSQNEFDPEETKFGDFIFLWKLEGFQKKFNFSQNLRSTE